jgi:hypothetical protein
MQAKLESSQGFNDIHEANDGIKLLRVIKTILSIFRDRNTCHMQFTKRRGNFSYSIRVGT